MIPVIGGSSPLSHPFVTPSGHGRSPCIKDSELITLIKIDVPP